MSNVKKIVYRKKFNASKTIQIGRSFMKETEDSDFVFVPDFVDEIYFNRLINSLYSENKLIYHPQLFTMYLDFFNFDFSIRPTIDAKKKLKNIFEKLVDKYTKIFTNIECENIVSRQCQNHVETGIRGSEIKNLMTKYLKYFGIYQEYVLYFDLVGKFSNINVTLYNLRKKVAENTNSLSIKDFIYYGFKFFVKDTDENREKYSKYQEYITFEN